jgi:hypothetical protein
MGAAMQRTCTTVNRGKLFIRKLLAILKYRRYGTSMNFIEHPYVRCVTVPEPDFGLGGGVRRP